MIDSLAVVVKRRGYRRTARQTSNSNWTRSFSTASIDHPKKQYEAGCEPEDTARANEADASNRDNYIIEFPVGNRIRVARMIVHHEESDQAKRY